MEEAQADLESRDAKWNRNGVDRKAQRLRNAYACTGAKSEQGRLGVGTYPVCGSEMKILGLKIGRI